MSKVIQFQSGWIKDKDKIIKINYGDAFQFEFCKNMLIPVYYLQINSQINQYIDEMSADQTIFVDFEFVPNFMVNQNTRPPPISIFTFCF